MPLIRRADRQILSFSVPCVFFFLFRLVIAAAAVVADDDDEDDGKQTNGKNVPMLN